MYSPRTVKTYTPTRPPRLTTEQRELVETTLNICAWWLEQKGATHVAVDQIDSPVMVTNVVGILQKHEDKVCLKFEPGTEAA